LSADWPRVFAEATNLNKATEVDCYPDRQDLNIDLLKIAREQGTRISLGTDAHHLWQLEFIELGLAAALKANLPADRIVNVMPIGELKSWVREVRGRAHREGRKPLLLATGRVPAPDYTVYKQGAYPASE